MSTKIYEAYRMIPHIMQDTFLPFYRNAAMEHAKNVIAAISPLVADHVSFNGYFDSLLGQYDYKMTEERIAIFKNHVVLREVLLNLKDVSLSPRRHPLNIDASLNVWHITKSLSPYTSKLFTVVIPYGYSPMDYGVKPPKGVKLYQYFNNTDKPDGISDDEWSIREAFWDRIHEDWNARRLEHNVIDIGRDIISDLIKYVDPNVNQYMVEREVKTGTKTIDLNL